MLKTTPPGPGPGGGYWRPYCSECLPLLQRTACRQSLRVPRRERKIAAERSARARACWVRRAAHHRARLTCCRRRRSGTPEALSQKLANRSRRRLPTGVLHVPESHNSGLACARGSQQLPPHNLTLAAPSRRTVMPHRCRLLDYAQPHTPAPEPLGAATRALSGREEWSEVVRMVCPTRRSRILARYVPSQAPQRHVRRALSQQLAKRSRDDCRQVCWMCQAHVLVAWHAHMAANNCLHTTSHAGLLLATPSRRTVTPHRCRLLDYAQPHTPVACGCVLLCTAPTDGCDEHNVHIHDVHRGSRHCQPGFGLSLYSALQQWTVLSVSPSPLLLLSPPLPLLLPPVLSAPPPSATLLRPRSPMPLWRAAAAEAES